jgi:hypothetical protein
MVMNRGATVEVPEDSELLEEQFNNIRQDCNLIVLELESLILENQHMGTDSEVTVEHLEDGLLNQQHLHVAGI